MLYITYLIYVLYITNYNLSKQPKKLNEQFLIFQKKQKTTKNKLSTELQNYNDFLYVKIELFLFPILFNEHNLYLRLH